MSLHYLQYKLLILYNINYSINVTILWSIKGKKSKNKRKEFMEIHLKTDVNKIQLQKKISFWNKHKLMFYIWYDVIW